MSIAATNSTQSLTSAILQQLLSGSNAQATSGLSPTVLQEVLTSSGVSQQGTANGTPAAISQALGNLLSGQGTSSQADLSQLQSYFKQNPDRLAGLLSSLQGGAGTYSADGTVGSSSSLLSALGINSGSTSSSTSTSPSSLINLLLGGQSQDPLLASLEGSSSSASNSSFSMLG